MLYICARLPVEALMVGEETGIITSIPMEKSYGEAGVSFSALSGISTSLTEEEMGTINVSLEGLHMISHRHADSLVEDIVNSRVRKTAEAVRPASSPASAPYIIPAYEWVMELAPYMESIRGRLRLRHAWWVTWLVLQEHGYLSETVTPAHWLAYLRVGLRRYDNKVSRSYKQEEKVCGKQNAKASQVFRYMPWDKLGNLAPSQWIEAAGNDSDLFAHAACAQNIAKMLYSLHNILVQQHTKASRRR